MSNHTVNFWDEAEKGKYVEDGLACHPHNDKDIKINIFCCCDSKIYIKEARDGIRINVKCNDNQECCSCCDANEE